MPVNVSKRAQKSQSGFGLVEVIVASALLGLLVIFSQNLLRSNMEFEHHTSDRYDLLSISQDIKSKVDCSKLPKTCKAGDPLTLVTSSGATLVTPTRDTRMNQWTVAADCGPQNNVVVRVAMQKPNGEFQKDPLTKKLLNWDHDLNVLMPAGTLCPVNPKDDETNSNPDVNIIAGQACIVLRKSLLPCNAPQPPPCAAGTSSSGVTLDTFGGGGDKKASSATFGQRWIRYCKRGD